MPREPGFESSDSAASTLADVERAGSPRPREYLPGQRGHLGALLHLCGVWALVACSPQLMEVVECDDACGAPIASGGSSSGRPAADAGAGGAEGGRANGGSAGSSSLFNESLIHRYDFEGNGTAVLDRVGDAHGTLHETELGVVDGRGAAILSGRFSGQYIELPSGIISVLANATFEAWVTWNGASVWERIFDFGDAVLGDNGVYLGSTYLFLTPRTPSEIGGVLRAAQQRLNERELVADTELVFPVDTRTHVAVVVDNDRRVLQLFVDGELLVAYAIVDRSGRSFDALSTINDQNNWLGRSQYEQDAFFGGVFHEFRIYSAALSAAEIAASYALGPDPGAD